MKKTLTTLLATVVLAAAPLTAASVADAATSHSARTHAAHRAKRLAAYPFDGGFTVASFNALGDSHTRPGGNKFPHWSQSPVRTARAIRLLQQHSIEVVGFQEFQGPQQRAFRRMAGDQYAVYSGEHLTDNAVAWRRDLFQLVSTDSVTVPYFFGKPKTMPAVLLEVRATGQQFWVTSFHNPANVHGPAQQWREEATRREADLANRLGASGLPVIFAGDMNEHLTYFQRLASSTDMHSFFGGDRDGSSMRRPDYFGIDWVFGNSHISFGPAERDESALVQRTTDHPVVFTEVHYHH